MSPDSAWSCASDLKRFDKWLTIFGGWRSEVPSEIAKGSRISSCIKVKGFRNIIHWEVTTYDPPKCVELKGRGRGGVRIGMNLTIADDDDGSTFHLRADLSGGVLSGPVGSVVARVLKGDIRKSVNNLAQLQKA